MGRGHLSTSHAQERRERKDILGKRGKELLEVFFPLRATNKPDVREATQSISSRSWTTQHSSRQQRNSQGGSELPIQRTPSQGKQKLLLAWRSRRMKNTCKKIG